MNNVGEIQIVTAQQWLIFVQGVIWHGGQGSLPAEGATLAGSRDRIKFLQRSEASLGERDKKQPQHHLVAILEWEHSGATFGQQSWAGERTRGQAEVPHAAAHRTGAGPSGYREWACSTSFQIPCRTAYSGRTLPNAFFIFLSIIKRKRV